MPCKNIGVNIVCCAPQLREGVSKPDPYAILSIGKAQQETTVMEKTADPVFEQTFCFLVSNPLTDTLLVRLMDKKSGCELAVFRQPLEAVFTRPEMRMPKQNFTLNTKEETKLKMSMEFKVLKVGGEPAKENLSMDPEPEEPATVSGNAGAHGDTISIGSAADVMEKPVEKQMARSENLHSLGSSVSSSVDYKRDTDSISSDIIEPEKRSLVTSCPVSGSNQGSKIRLTIRYRYAFHNSKST